MIYLFHGTDAQKARTKAFAWVAAVRQKQRDAVYVRLEGKDITATHLYEIASTQGLFFRKTLTLIDDPFARKEEGDILLEHLALLANSENPIAILAPKLLAAQKKALVPKAEKEFLCDTIEKKPVRGFNGALVNALGAKDGAALWKEIVKAGRAGDAPEMIHGLLHWKARDMMHKGSTKWGSAGARSLSHELIELLSDSRSGELPLSEALERFALSLR